MANPNTYTRRATVAAGASAAAPAGAPAAAAALPPAADAEIERLFAAWQAAHASTLAADGDSYNAARQADWDAAEAVTQAAAHTLKGLLMKLEAALFGFGADDELEQIESAADLQPGERAILAIYRDLKRIVEREGAYPTRGW